MSWWFAVSSMDKSRCNVPLNSAIIANIQNGYSLLHNQVSIGDPILLLAMWANANLVGFDTEWSPRLETPISLSMYRANNIVALQRALRITAADLECTIHQALEKHLPIFSHWTVEDMIELLSADLDLSPVSYSDLVVCPYCLYSKAIIVQLYWMRILQSITRRTRSQSIQNLIGTMLSMKSPPAYENKIRYQHIPMHTKNIAKFEISDEQFSDRNEKSSLLQTDDDAMKKFNIYNGISIDNEGMCVFCWHEWEEIALKPLLNQNKWLRCDLSINLASVRGKRRWL